MQKLGHLPGQRLPMTDPMFQLPGDDELASARFCFRY